MKKIILGFFSLSVLSGISQVDTIDFHVNRASTNELYTANSLGSAYGYSVGSGYYLNSGNVFFLTDQSGMYFDGISNSYVTEVLCPFGAVDIVNNADTIYANVYSVNQDSSANQLLGSAQLLTSDLTVSAATPLQYSSFIFNTPIPTNGSPYIVSIDFESFTDDTVGIYSSSGSTSDGNGEKRWRIKFAPNFGGTWVAAEALYGSSDYDPFIVPIICTSSNPVSGGTEQFICDGEQTTLTGSGGTPPYNWNGGITDGVGFVPPLGTNFYTVSGSDTNNCANSSSVTVNVLTPPMVNAGVDQTICSGDSVALLGTGVGSYNWTMGITNGVPFIPPFDTTTSYIHTRSNAGCSSKDTVYVTALPLPNPTITLNGFVLNVGGGFVSYQWLLNGTNINGAQDTIYTPSANGDYTVLVEDSNGCLGISSIYSYTNSNINLVEHGSISGAINVYPNPSNGLFWVNTNPNTIYNVTNLLGELIVTGRNTGNKFQISLSQQPNGIYFLDILENGRLSTAKLIKNN